MAFRFAAFVAGVLAGAALAAPAQAAGPLEKTFWMSGPRYSGALPDCADPGVLGDLQARFADKEGTFWNSPLQIAGFARVRELAYRPGPPDTIPRRFCTARALTSDGATRTVNYSIGEDTGPAGFTWGLDFCMTGLDRNWAYAPACRMARP